MDLIFHYYGVDWVATATTMLSIYLLGTKKRSGFVWGFFAALSWFIFNTMVMTIAGMLANLILMVLHIRGYVRWKASPSHPKKP